MRPDSNIPPAYSYVVGEDTDSLWNSKTCIEVEPKPTANHEYDLEKKEWILNESYYMSDLRFKRNAELDRTDKYMISDYPLSSENKASIIVYRQSLRECPNKELLVDKVLPECPEIFR